MATERTQKRLGRGLDALLGARDQEAPPAPASALQQLPLDQISPNPLQPRREFKPEELAELQKSLDSSGLLQPITVRLNPAGRGYQLVAGERRWRAAQALGWETISAVVREADDHTLLALALVENLQRSDLNALEEAEGYKRLVSEFGLSAQKVAELTGKSRSTVANFMRLLELPAPVQALVRSGDLTAGQVRPLLALGDEKAIIELAEEVRRRKLPARAVEERTAKRALRKKGAAAGVRRDPGVAETEERLRRFLQTDISVKPRRGGGGQIAVRFYSADDLERILDRIGLGGTE